MELKCKINGKEHKITQGVSFSEEYNETLDSGSVIITSNEQLDIKPYDDVFFYDNEFNGYNFNAELKKAELYSEKKQINDYEMKIYINKNLLNINENLSCNVNVDYHPKNEDLFTYNFSSEGLKFVKNEREKFLNFENFYYAANPFNREDVYFFGGVEVLNDGAKIPNLKLRKTNSTFSNFTNGVDIFDETTNEIIDYQRLNYGLLFNIKPVVLEKDDNTIEFYFPIRNYSGRFYIAKIVLNISTSKAIFSLFGRIYDTYTPCSLCADYKKQRLYLCCTGRGGGVIDPALSSSSIFCYDLINGDGGSPEMVDFGTQEVGEIIKFDYAFFDSVFTSNEDYTEIHIFAEKYKLKLSDYKTLESHIEYSIPFGKFFPIVKKTNGVINDLGFIHYDIVYPKLTYNIYDSSGQPKTSAWVNVPNKNFTLHNIGIISYINYTDFNFKIDFMFSLTEIDYNIVKKINGIKGDIIKNNEQIILSFTPPKDAIMPNKFIFTQDIEKENKLSTLVNYGERKTLVDFNFLIYYFYKPNALDPKKNNKFYKHLLVDSVTEEILNLEEKIYRYKISLFSETKGLEIIQLPNKSITQPLIKDKKKNVYWYALKILELYNPKIKVSTSLYNNTWSLAPKYILDNSIAKIFEDAIVPDFSENNPNLRDILSKLFLVKDRIPVVKDDVIYAMDITERKQPFDLTKGQINYINSTLSSANYCNNLKKNYNEALSQIGSGRYIEHLGFRNSDTALMTLENMRIETKFPIYKINKIYMCYYKKVAFKKSEDTTISVKAFLCKQDITPLVKLNSERNLLSQDWNDFISTKPSSIEEMKKYKLCTVGYDIGSKYITGWGTKYKYPKGWWKGDGTATYIENIARILDLINPYGIYDYGYITRFAQSEWGQNAYISNYDADFFNNLIAPTAIIKEGVNANFNNAAKLKCFTFIIDYEPFYNGTVVHSKNFGDKDITINDNPSASLTLLEADGLFTQEKLNRYGNKNIMIPARYTDFNDLQELGSIYNNGKDTDVIIYHREYNIFDNLINCTYYGSKDYVLKNYFTTVWAKHRTYNLMSYSESITRAENKKIYLFMSKKAAYFEKPNGKNSFIFDKFESRTFLAQIFSFFRESDKAISIDYFKDGNKLNFAYFEKDKKIYVTDVNSFVSGNSLCLNICMFDNIMAGTYIKEFNPFHDRSYSDMLIPSINDIANDYTGSVQGWYNLTDDETTGEIQKISFYFSHFDLSEKIMDVVSEINVNNPNENNPNEKMIQNVYYNYFFGFPYLPNDVLETQKNVIGYEELPIYKDNKEKLDFTLQFEAITDDENVMFSSWMMKLSDLITPYKKTNINYKVTDTGLSPSTVFIDLVATTYTGPYTEDSEGTVILPDLFLKIKEEDFEKINVINTELVGEAVWNKDMTALPQKMFHTLPGFNVKLKKIKEISANKTEIKIICDYFLKVNWSWWGSISDEFTENVEVTFTRVDNKQGNIDYDFYKGYIFFECRWKTISFVDTKGKAHNFGVSYSPIVDKTDGVITCSNDRHYNLTFYPLNSKNSITTKCYVFSADSIRKTKEYHKNLYYAYTPENLKKETVYDELNTWKYWQNNLTGDDYSKIRFGIVEKENEPPYLNILVDKSIIIKQNDGSYGSARLYFLDTEGDNYYHFVFGVNITEEDYNNVIDYGGYNNDFCQIKIYLSSLYTKDNHIFDKNHNLIGENQNYIKNPDKIYGQNQYFYDTIEEQKKGDNNNDGNDIIE